MHEKHKYGLGAGTVSKYGFKLVMEVYEKYNHKCSVCGSVNYLHIHHIDGKGSHNRENGLETNDSLGNLQLICRSCHGKIHGKQHRGNQYTKNGKEHGWLKKGRDAEYQKELYWKKKERK